MCVSSAVEVGITEQVGELKELVGIVMANKYKFSKGESVRIKAGVFRAFIGRVAEIYEGKGMLRVIVEVFGKSQLVELTFLDVEKVE